MQQLLPLFNSPISRPEREKAIRERFKIEAVRIYKGGKLGCKSIAAQLGATHKVIRAILIKEGIYQPGKLKRIEGGPWSRNPQDPLRIEREKRHKTIVGIRAAIRRMRARASFCLSRRAAEYEVGSSFDWEGMGMPKGLNDAGQEKWRYANCAHHKWTVKLRARLQKIIRRNGCGRDKNLYGTSYLEWLGCSPDEFVRHIEAQFQDGMNWDNYGRANGNWELDHYIPVSVYNLEITEQRKDCYHYSNIRPLWRHHNQAKGRKILASARALPLPPPLS